MVFFLREAWGQIREAQPDSAKVELMATYPNHSRQGVFPNPAIFPELGEWTYAAACFGEGQGVLLQVNKQVWKGIWANAIWYKGAVAVTGSFEIADWMLLGASASTGGKSEAGAVFIPVHTTGNLTQIGARYCTDGTCQFGAESRQAVGRGWAATVSGQATADGKGLRNYGFGAQAANGKWQLSAGVGSVRGKAFSWKNFSGAARRVIRTKKGNFIGEVRLVPGGEVQAGITYMIPSRR
jgi:hypothetical protein